MSRITTAPPLSAGFMVISLLRVRLLRASRSFLVMFCLRIVLSDERLILISFRLTNVSRAGEPVGALQLEGSLIFLSLDISEKVPVGVVLGMVTFLLSFSLLKNWMVFSLL